MGESFFMNLYMLAITSYTIACYIHSFKSNKSMQMNHSLCHLWSYGNPETPDATVEKLFCTNFAYKLDIGQLITLLHVFYGFTMCPITSVTFVIVLMSFLGRSRKHKMILRL